MKSRHHDPRRLDVEQFAADKGTLDGSWPLLGMPRLVGACHADENFAAQTQVSWQLSGELRREAGGEPHAWLMLRLGAEVQLTCQRCLGAVATPLRVERWFHFVESEALAAKLDLDSEDDVLVSVRALDLHQLAEDELLLALPLVPRHDVCPQPLPAQLANSSTESDEAPSPFAVLAAFKRGVH